MLVSSLLRFKIVIKSIVIGKLGLCWRVGSLVSGSPLRASPARCGLVLSEVLTLSGVRTSCSLFPCNSALWLVTSMALGPLLFSLHHRAFSDPSLENPRGPYSMGHGCAQARARSFGCPAEAPRTQRSPYFLWSSPSGTGDAPFALTTCGVGELQEALGQVALMSDPHSCPARRKWGGPAPSWRPLSLPSSPSPGSA